MWHPEPGRCDRLHVTPLTVRTAARLQAGARTLGLRTSPRHSESAKRDEESPNGQILPF